MDGNLYDFDENDSLFGGIDADVSPIRSPDPHDESDQFSEPDVVSLSLAEFVSVAQDLLSDMAEFCQFVLTGKHRNTQYQVDPIKDTLHGDHRIQALRDYDSVLGLHKDICVRTYLTVYPVSKLEDTLCRNIHIKYSFSNEMGEYNNIPVHSIPNLCIAKWGTHNMIRVILPGLYDDQRRTPFLTQAELAIFYEKGLRPAIEELAGDAVAEWPPSYSAEMFRARGKNGTLSFQTKTLPEWLVGSLGDSIRDALSRNGVSWGDGLIFLHQIRGVKASNGHTPTRVAAYESLDQFFDANNIVENCHAEGSWWIDVGLEISSQEHHCLAWRTDSHFHIVKYALNIPSKSAERITSVGSSKYVRDLTSHLTSVSGCRISPGVRAQGPHRAVYFQMYTTDKSITYRHDGSHFGKFLKGQDILKGKADDYCHELYEVYRQAATKNYGLARVEVRIPLSEAADVLADLDVRIFRGGLVAIDPVVWWSLRAYRLLAFKHVLERQALGDVSYRATNSALLLTAAAPWFINGIHSTPNNGSASRDLMGKILPTVNRADADPETLAYPASTRASRAQMVRELAEEEEEDEEDGQICVDHDREDNMSVASDLSDTAEAAPQRVPRNNRSETLPHNPYGIVFLRPIRIGEGITMPRFENYDVPMITEKTFYSIFGIDRDDVDNDFFKSKLVIPSNPHRMANRVRRTAVRAPEEQAPPLFHLSERGYQLEAPAADRGSDFDELQYEVQALHGEEDEDIDARLSSLWTQFVFDITVKAPNPRSAMDVSYCILTPEQRNTISDATYQNLRLREYFTDCQYRNATKDEWDAAFDKFWPLIPILVGKPQNLPNMRYYISWSKLIDRLNSVGDQETIVEMRNVLRKRFHTFAWIPNIQTDRVWYTKVDHRFSRFPELDARRPAPRILIRWGLTAIVPRIGV